MPQRAMAGGGALDSSNRNAGAAPGIVVNGGITVKVAGNLTDPDLPRNVAVKIQQALIKLERSSR